MELVIRWQEGELPRIGIKYIYEFQAVRAYEELIGQTGNSVLSATIEFSGQRILLILSSEFNGRSVHYKDLEFRQNDVHRLMRLKPPFLFVHVYPQKNTLLIAKPFRKAGFLNIISLQFRGGGGAQL